MIQFSSFLRAGFCLSLVAMSVMGRGQTPFSPRPAVPHDQREFGPQSERFEALRVAFVTEFLSLTPGEAEVFWPAQRAAEAEMMTIQAELHAVGQAVQNSESLSAEECVAHMSRITALRHAQVDAQAAWLEHASELIGPERAIRIPLMQERFRQRIAGELERRRSGAPATRPIRPRWR